MSLFTHNLGQLDLKLSNIEALKAKKKWIGGTLDFWACLSLVCGSSHFLQSINISIGLSSIK